MKKNILILVIALIFGLSSNAQNKIKTETKVISLEQTKGEFTQKKLTITSGDYIFEISNNNVGHKVGFVLVPKGKIRLNQKIIFLQLM
ncbi:hypothetical protein [Winogradskyella sp. PG-2]|uniref:hypothetical protein n=1 Tax=Winogradskyella sp. PG-2 TaxID=754409 RepID=UPI0004586897|nr:hypothetical protein [Winogradskyella sp. PG-2]BAO75718.1 hypothetical protein WPG_1488 [Winogradskyella sp. PG-2]